MVATKFQTGLACGGDCERTGSFADSLSSRFRKSRLDARDQFLSELCSGAGVVRLVRTLGLQWPQAGVHVRVRGSVYVGLDNVSRLVQRAARVGQCGGAVGVLPR